MHIGSPLLREFDRWCAGHERAEQRIEVTMASAMICVDGIGALANSDLDAGNGLRDRRGRLDQARLRRGRVLGHFGAFSLGADESHRLDPRRVAQPQGQSNAGQSPGPDSRLQHRSELSALSGDVCSASDDMLGVW